MWLMVKGEKVMDLYENREQLKANYNFPDKRVVA